MNFIFLKVSIRTILKPLTPVEMNASLLRISLSSASLFAATSLSAAFVVDSGTVDSATPYEGGGHGFFSATDPVGNPNWNGPYTIRSNDLANSGEASLQSISISNGGLESGWGPLSVVNDGSAPSGTSNAILADATGRGGDVTAGTYVSSPPLSYTLNIVFDTSVNTLGYDITQIQSFAAAGDRRKMQYIDISYSQVGSGTFTSFDGLLVDGTTDPTSSAPSTATNSLNSDAEGNSWIVAYDDGGGAIATGVDEIRVDVYLPRENNGTDAAPSWREAATGLREIDVIGTAAVPEPGAAAALFGIGALAFVCCRRRK